MKRNFQLATMNMDVSYFRDIPIPETATMPQLREFDEAMKAIGCSQIKEAFENIFQVPFEEPEDVAAQLEAVQSA